jgi:hypothetical protein
MNPWTSIALADYEGHMAFPAIGQAAMLAEEFRQAVAATSPRSVALLGCAGGNGLEALDGSAVERVVCVDINPAFLAALETRHRARLPGLECHAGEVESFRSAAPVDLVFGGLVFEYTRLDEAIESVAWLLRAGGNFHAVLQCPAEGLATVSPSPHAAALASVGACFRHVDAPDLIRHAAHHGLWLQEDREVRLASGKSFRALHFLRREV